MNRGLAIALGASGLLFVSTAGQAVTSTGTIGATLTLTNGCLINGSPSQNGINFGTLNFGSSPATFSTLSTQLSGAAGGNTFTIQCTTAEYTVQVTSSNNTAPATVIGTPGTPGRYLVNTIVPAQGVAYSIFSDSAFNNVIANNAPIPATTTVAGISTYTMYGRIVGGGNNPVVVPGTYTDTINVSVTY